MVKQWNLAALPSSLRTEIGAGVWQQITLGESGAYLYRLMDQQGQNRYLKIMPQQLKMSIEREAQVLKWLAGKLPVPKVLLFISDCDYEYLLMTEAEGVPACDQSFGRELPLLIRLLAKGLRMIHSIDLNNCPFDQRLDVKIKAAESRMHQGLVEEADFDAERQGRKAADLFAELLVTKPAEEDLVFTHGDYCLPNIMIHNGEISGFIDWGRGGIADRYQDLALAARSIASNFGAAWLPLFFKEYGLDEPDYAKIEFYKLLDEFF